MTENAGNPPLCGEPDPWLGKTRCVYEQDHGGQHGAPDEGTWRRWPIMLNIEDVIIRD